MLLTTLVRAAGGFRHGSHLFRALTPITCRTLFHPSAPPPSLDLTDGAAFPPEDRAHLSQGQFYNVRHSGRTEIFPREEFGGMIPEKQETAKWGPSTPEQKWEQSSNRFVNLQEPVGIHRGRTVLVKHHRNDVGQAYARLQAILRDNNVRKELRLAERHEKKGAKRRRLRSERWRRKFADEVRKKVKLVTEIRLRDRMWGSRH